MGWNRSSDGEHLPGVNFITSTTIRSFKLRLDCVSRRHPHLAIRGSEAFLTPVLGLIIFDMSNKRYPYLSSRMAGLV